MKLRWSIAALLCVGAAIWMLVDGLPKAHVLPMFRAKVAAKQPPVTFAIAPTGIAGTF